MSQFVTARELVVGDRILSIPAAKEIVFNPGMNGYRLRAVEHKQGATVLYLGNNTQTIVRPSDLVEVA